MPFHTLPMAPAKGVHADKVLASSSEEKGIECIGSQATHIPT